MTNLGQDPGIPIGCGARLGPSDKSRCLSMAIRIGNAPCSWGVEFARAESNPPWRTVLAETRKAGYAGIELGPVGYMPGDPAILAAALQDVGLSLTAGVVFRRFHDPAAWAELEESLRSCCRTLRALDAPLLVLIDSLDSERSQYAGDSRNSPRLNAESLRAMHERLRVAAAIGRDEFGLAPCIHAHAGGYIEFEDELEQVLDAIDESVLGICLDTGHSLYAGFDPIATYRRHASRVRYIHLKDVDESVLRPAVSERVGFYEACARGVFCNLGDGALDFRELRSCLEREGYSGWATVEQDRGPLSVQSSFEDALANHRFLQSVGMAT